MLNLPNLPTYLPTNDIPENCPFIFNNKSLRKGRNIRMSTDFPKTIRTIKAKLTKISRPISAVNSFRQFKHIKVLTDKHACGAYISLPIKYLSQYKFTIHGVF